MVLLNNAHYPNDMLPARVTVHIQDFFNTLDLFAAAEQVGVAYDNEEGDDEDSDSSNAQFKSLDLDQQGTSGVQKSPEISKAHEVEVSEADYVPGQEAVNTEQGNVLNFDLSEFFRSEYLSFLDSSDPTQLSLALSPQWSSIPSMNLETHQF